MWKRNMVLSRPVTDDALATIVAVAQRVARKFSRIYKYESADDFFQVAAYGALCAHERWNPALGRNYTRWLYCNADGEVRHYIRDAMSLIIYPRDRGPGNYPWVQSLDEMADDGPVHVLPYEEMGFASVEAIDEIARFIAHRSDVAKRAMCLYWFADMSQSEIAIVLGVSQVHVGRLIRKSLRRPRGSKKLSRAQPTGGMSQVANKGLTKG